MGQHLKQQIGLIYRNIFIVAMSNFLAETYVLEVDFLTCIKLSTVLQHNKT